MSWTIPFESLNLPTSAGTTFPGKVTPTGAEGFTQAAGPVLPGFQGPLTVCARRASSELEARAWLS